MPILRVFGVKNGGHFLSKMTPKMTPFFQVLISTGPEITVNLRRFEGYRPKGVKKGVQKGSKRPFLAKNGHFLDPFFDKKWSKKWSDFAPEQCKIRVFPDPVSAKNRSKMVKNQDLRPPKMAQNDPFWGPKPLV